VVLPPEREASADTKGFGNFFELRPSGRPAGPLINTATLTSPSFRSLVPIF
jgi:hypothetical protein